jgi:hypothetical protein
MKRNGLYFKRDERVCPQCLAVSGDDWSQCQGSCPMQASPHFDPSRLREGERCSCGATREWRNTAGIWVCVECGTPAHARHQASPLMVDEKIMPIKELIIYHATHLKELEERISVLREILRRMRWHDQGGYPGLHDGKWSFISTSLPQTTPEELDELFKLVGITPDEIESLGPCEECANAQEYEDGTRSERGYEEPCSTCKRPRHSNFVPMEKITR